MLNIMSLQNLHSHLFTLGNLYVNWSTSLTAPTSWGSPRIRDKVRITNMQIHKLELISKKFAYFVGLIEQMNHFELHVCAMPIITTE